MCAKSRRGLEVVWVGFSGHAAQVFRSALHGAASLPTPPLRYNEVLHVDEEAEKGDASMLVQSKSIFNFSF